MFFDFAPVRTEAPTGDVVTLAEAKAHVRYDDSDQDAYITALVAAAVGYLDGWTGVLGRALLTQEWRQDFRGFSERLRLPMIATSVVSVTNGGDTVADTVYVLRRDHLGSYVTLKTDQSWPSVATGDAPVSVTFECGYGAAADVPAPIKQWILLTVGDWFRNRETGAVGAKAGEIPMSAGARALLAAYSMRHI